MRSLSSTISLSLIGMLCCIGLIAAALSYFVALYEAGQFMDDQMRQFATVVGEQTPLVDKLDGLEEPEDRFEVMIWTVDGKRISSLAEPITIDQGPSGFRTQTVGGETWRLFVARTTPLTIMVAQHMSARGELALHAAFEVALPILAMIPLAWLVVTATLGRALNRLSALGEEVATRSIGSPSTVTTTGLPTEIIPFVIAINELTLRLQTALHQQRRFIADSAHQLRTPLSALRLQIDNLYDPSVSKDLNSPLHHGINRVSTVLNQLLHLARFDAPRLTTVPDVIDLVELVTQCIADHVEIAEAAGIDIGLVSADPVQVRIMRADLETLLTNIIDNAVRYSPRGSSVDCVIFRAARGSIAVRIVDNGPGVSDMDLPQLTDRFFRGAGVETTGNGLGLAIVKSIADRYGLELSIQNRIDGAGLSVQLMMPFSIISQ